MMHNVAQYSRETYGYDAPNLYHCQNFNHIRDWCLERGLLFEDPYFKLDSNYEWKRPWEISKDPQLFVDGSCRFDVVQGLLQDCWIVAAVSTLSLHPDLVQRVIQSDQSFTHGYAGIFHFRFWQFGKWFDVVIDDRLPTAFGKLVFTQSATHNEFWSALFEKAYCKILGDSYATAKEGNLCEALQDFTGGVVEQFYLRSLPRNFQSFLLKSIERNTLVGCFIDSKVRSVIATPEGLLIGHSYSITGAKCFDIPHHGRIVLVRLRNPWGRYEWQGPWCDNSKEWDSVPKKIKKELGVVSQEDGEFWMSYSDFITRFEWVDMCHLSPTAFSDLDENDSEAHHWELNMFRGKWVQGVTAGGCKSLHENPQIRFVLNEVDTGSVNGLSSVLVALLQNTTGNRFEPQNEIGFKVFHVKDPNYKATALDKQFFTNNHSVAKVPLKRTREVAGRFNFEKGVYCVIPYTFDAGKEGQFILRIYSEKKTVMDQVHHGVNISKINIEVIEGPPMEVETDKDTFKKEEYLKHQFNLLSGETKRINYKELKSMLNFAVRNENNPTERGSIWKSIFNDITTNYLKILQTRSAQPNAFHAIGPEGFSTEVCKRMLASVDVDRSGTIIFDEFKQLWKEIMKWKFIYEENCNEEDGYLKLNKLKSAFAAAGFHLNDHILGEIVYKYSDNGIMTFNEFLNCGVKLKRLSDMFRSVNVRNSHKVELTLDEYIGTVIIV